MSKVVVTQSDKDYICSALDQAIASAKRLSNRSGQLPFAVEGYKKEADAIVKLRLKVADWDVAQ